jgi:hypothetical protein
VPAARAGDRTIVDLLAADGRFERFLRLCQRANVTGELKAADPVTVFALTNAASGRIPKSLIADLPGIGGERVPSMVRLRAWVLFHGVQGRHPSAGWPNTQELQTSKWKRLRVGVPQGEPMRLLRASNPTLSTAGFGAGGFATNHIAAIRSPDLVTSNGIVHGIDKPVLP